jgi:hypothetical protein
MNFSSISKRPLEYIYKTKKRHSRRLLVSTVDPPLHSDILERPCTVLLVEDRNVYQTSWREAFQDKIPKEYGMSFGYLELPTAPKSVDEGLKEMNTELPAFHDAVLVARGPFVSWYAQFFLESFPLKGLVLVDPLCFDRVRGDEQDLATNRLERDLQDHGLESAREFQQLQAIYNGLETRKLKLEPNAVPMRVFQTLPDPGYASAAVETAERHSDPDGPFGIVSVRDFSLSNNIDEIMIDIRNWIDQDVL